MSEYERWESRFEVPDYIFGKAPNYFLVSCRRLLPVSGRALAVADGEGRNGVWLADQGLAVVLVSHNLVDVFEVATRITVLRLGRNVAVYEKDKTNQQEVVEAITFGAPAPEEVVA